MKRRLGIAVALLALSFGALAGSFDAHHPDQYFRQRAAERFDAGRYRAALADFRRSARYADKASQLALAMAYWDGKGVTADPSTAYAWADVAAERGYPEFLAVRERMWSELSAAQRERALAIGERLHARYGDAVAKRRLESHMKRGLVQKTGTRTGSHVTPVSVSLIDSAGLAALRMGTSSTPLNNVGPDSTSSPPALTSRLMVALSGFGTDGYYSAERWEPVAYWEQQDDYWNDLAEGTVEVGPLRTEVP